MQICVYIYSLSQYSLKRNIRAGKKSNPQLFIWRFQNKTKVTKSPWLIFQFQKLHETNWRITTCTVLFLSTHRKS